MCCVPNFVREENNFVCIVEAREHTEMLAEYQQIQQASDTQCVIVNKLDGNRGPHKATRFWKSHINRSPLLCATRRAGRADAATERGKLSFRSGHLQQPPGTSALALHVQRTVSVWPENAPVLAGL